MSEGQDVLDMEDTQRLLNTTTRDTDRNARLRNLLRKYDVIPVKNNLDDFEEKYSEVCNLETFPSHTYDLIARELKLRYENISFQIVEMR